jgi:threonine dehydrogenase-like Zn-dependent dehydrogenase
MLAMNYRGPRRVRADQKPMPEILHPNDAIIRVTRSCICGSDLHLYHGLVPDTRVGTTFGHEFIGVVEEIGPSVQKLKVGDNVLVLLILLADNVRSVNKSFTETAMNQTHRLQQ